MIAYSAKLDQLAQSGEPFRLGIYGGTFDPIHIGHLLCAEKAREAFNLDMVLFVPAGRPSFKRDQYVTPGHYRLDMCRMAVASNPYFDVSELEVQREGISYTVDTLRELHAAYPQAQLFFITGDDALATIMKWHESAAIAQLCEIITVLRPEQEIDPALQARISNEGHFRVHYLNDATIPVSSTELRQAFEEGRSVRYLIPDTVRAYIDAKQLYAGKVEE